jgi:hypothetical protein
MFYGTVLYSLMRCPEAEALLKGAEAGATAAASGQPQQQLLPAVSLSNSCCQRLAQQRTHTLHLQYVYVRRS